MQLVPFATRVHVHTGLDAVPQDESPNHELDVTVTPKCYEHS